MATIDDVFGSLPNSIEFCDEVFCIYIKRLKLLSDLPFVAFIVLCIDGLEIIYVAFKYSM